MLWIIRRKNRELEDLRRALEDQEPQFVERVINIARSHKLRTIAGRAHLRELRRALDGAQETLVIVSGWVNDYVVDRDFTERLTRALARGVNVYVGFGWTLAAKPTALSPHEVRGISNLERLSEEATRRWTGRLYLAKWPNHAKLLICDDQWAICGSQNWLSNRGFSNEERSWAIHDPEFVRAERDILIRRIRLGCEAGVAG